MDFFGLDIGAHSIKIAQLKHKSDGFHLVAFGSGPSTGKGLLSEAESDLVNLAEAIKKILQEAKIKTKNVAAAFPQDRVFTRVVTVPKLSEEELVSALKWEAEQFIPVPLKEITLAHQVVGQVSKDSKEKTRVILVAVSNHLIEKMIKVLETAGLTPVTLETEIISMARSLVPSDSGTAMVVDLGATATDLAVVEDGQVVLVHSIGTAGETLTRAMVTQLGLETSQAEAYKKAYGADPQRLEGKLLKAIGPLLEKIITEVEKTIQFHQSSGAKKQISRVILTGGTAGLPEVAALLAKKLNLEIQLGDPFVQVKKGDLETKIPSGEAFLFSAAIGLAMKKME